ncbi:MAG: glycosyltransferase [Candidatus Omnitrophica bacterium]|nr:glycosyltransferase [Candidatus Omnitrophota bacterium]
MNRVQEEFQLSVIIPAYSERESLIQNVRLALKNEDVLEVIILLAGAATKETLEISKKLAATENKVTYHIQKNNPGLGYALRQAFNLVRGTHVQILYADCESDPMAIPLFIHKARETGADMVVASRWMPGGKVYNYPPLRYFFNRAYQQFFRILFRTQVHDLTFGYNLIKTSVLRSIVWQGKKHEITTEMVLKALKLGYHLEEIPVVWKRRNEGKSAHVIIRYLYYPLIALSIFMSPKESLCSTAKPKPGMFSHLRRMLDSNVLFIVLLAVFVSITAIVLYHRDGKDLKVGLYAVSQVIQKKSPYVNPNDPARPIFRYAPGVTILEHPFFLKTKVIGPYKLVNTRPSIYAWFLAEILALLGSAWFLFKLVPAVSQPISLRNLKLSFVLALPLIIYEVLNSQNKLIALFFMLAAIFLFEKRRPAWSALCFNIALTIYVALLPFLFFFLIRDRRYIINFIIAVLIVFFLVPTLIFGFDFNIFLLREWMQSLHSFFNTNSYMTYVDLRRSSQSIPSVVGRIFVTGHTGHFTEFIAPVFIHIIIRGISLAVFLYSCFAIWYKPKEAMRGLTYVIFLILALILPQYCVYYTWAYLFVFYFAVFNYVSYPDVPFYHKRGLLVLTSVLCIASYMIVFHCFSYYSMLFWATITFWAGITTILLGRPSKVSNPVSP